jgi:hypothetical protein
LPQRRVPRRRGGHRASRGMGHEPGREAAHAGEGTGQGTPRHLIQRIPRRRSDPHHDRGRRSQPDGAFRLFESLPVVPPFRRGDRPSKARARGVRPPRREGGSPPSTRSLRSLASVPPLRRGTTTRPPVPSEGEGGSPPSTRSLRSLASVPPLRRGTTAEPIRCPPFPKGGPHRSPPAQTTAEPGRRSAWFGTLELWPSTSRDSTTSSSP